MHASTVLEEYRLACSAKGISPKTWRWYDQKLNVFLAFLKAEYGLTEIEVLAPRHVNRFVEWLRETPSLNGRGVRSTYTIRGYVECIKNFISWASEDEGLLDEKLQARIALPKVQKVIIKTLSREQFHALLSATDREPQRMLQLRDQAILCLLLATGVRASELCTLRVQDVYLGQDDESFVRVLGKGNKWREVGPLGVLCQKHLRRHLRGHSGDRESTLFASRLGSGTRPLTPSGLDQLLKRLRDWAGEEQYVGIRLSAHTFRHTFAVNYLKQGGDIKRLQLLLGHTSLAVTQHYLEDFQQRDARRGLSVLDGF